MWTEGKEQVMSEPITGRTVVANISLSLDGRVNGAGGEYDMSWVAPHAISNVARDYMIRFTSPATTVLLGRKNYEGFGGYWPAVADQEDADPRDRAVSRWMNDVEKIVFSSTTTNSTWSHSTITGRAPADVVAELRSQPGGDILAMSSSSIIRQLLEADLVDRLQIILCPEISGGGDRLFDDTVPRSAWRLVNSEVADTGAICLTYERSRPSSE
jgi:dihydrofolate reductase